MKMGYWLHLQSLGFLLGGGGGGTLVSTPFGVEEGPLKLTQMQPKDEKNKEHKDNGLKNNTFFFFLYPSFFFFFVSQCSDFAVIDIFECWRLANKG